jgi:hypothetical protein
MSTHAAFLAAIAANPMDHLPKLVYADWLEELGDPRFEYLRLQHVIAEAFDAADGWFQTLARRHELVATLDAEWLTAASVGLEWIGEIRDKNDYLRRVTLAAERGNTVAMLSLANRSLNTPGQKRDFRSARTWLQRAVDVGHAPAMYVLGRMYKSGAGLWLQHPKKAAELFRRASDLGLAPAMVELAKMYAAGEGVRQSTPEAVRLYRLAADKGEAEAYRHLGNRYRDGRGVPREAKEAAKHYRRAIELGDEEARQPLAALLLKHPELSE